MHQLTYCVFVYLTLARLAWHQDLVAEQQRLQQQQQQQLQQQQRQRVQGPPGIPLPQIANAPAQGAAALNTGADIYAQAFHDGYAQCISDYFGPGGWGGGGGKHAGGKGGYKGKKDGKGSKDKGSKGSSNNNNGDQGNNNKGSKDDGKGKSEQDQNQDVEPEDQDNRLGANETMSASSTSWDKCES